MLKDNRGGKIDSGSRGQVNISDCETFYSSKDDTGLGTPAIWQ